MEKLARSRVAVFGLGGVGGHALEALARSGVGALDLIDSDAVAESNLNRQILATRDSVGAVYKVSVGVLKKTTEDEIPSLVQTVRSIGRHFLGMHLAGCSCVKAAYEPVYSPEQFREKRQFTGVVVLSFRTVERHEGEALL